MTCLLIAALLVLLMLSASAAIAALEDVADRLRGLKIPRTTDF